MNIFLAALIGCFAAAWALEEEFTITAGKTRRQGNPSFGPSMPMFYPTYGNFQQAAGYPANTPYTVNSAYLPLVQGANPTLVYSPQTGQIYSGYPIQQAAPQQLNSNPQQMYNDLNQGYGGAGAPGSGSNNAYGAYGAGPTAGDQNMVGCLSDSFINSVNQAAGTWTAASNFDETPDMYNYIGDLCGVLDAEVGKPNLLAPVSYNKKDIPAEFDARTYKGWEACTSLKEIRDQGACGSCWAISAVESMTDRICIATGGKTRVHLSTQDLLECCRSCGKKCDGGYPGAAWTYFKDVGIVSGGEYDSPKAERFCKPYDVPPCAHHSKKSNKPQCSKGVQSPQCRKTCENGAQYNGDLHFGSYDSMMNKTIECTFPTSYQIFGIAPLGDIAYSVDSKVESIQLEILNYGSVEAAYDVYEDFMSYSKGVYKHVQGKKVGGHAVKMLGWGTDNGADFWLCANSWGTDWGDEGGFFRIQRGTNECNIESNIVAGKPKVDGKQPTPSPSPSPPGPPGPPGPLPPPPGPPGPPGPTPPGYGPLLTVPTAPLLNNRINNGIVDGPRVVLN